MKHINYVHKGQKDHKCDSCGMTFSQSGNLNEHITSVHTNNGLNSSIKSIIDKCMSNYTTFNIQNMQTQTKHDMKQETGHMNQEMGHKEKILIFQETKLENSPEGFKGIHVSCGVCHIEMDGTESLIRHLKDQHNPQKTQFSNENTNNKLEKNPSGFKGIRVPCHICHREFDTKSLNRHLRVRHDQGPQKGLRYPQRSKSYGLKNQNNIEMVVMKEEASEENEINENKNTTNVEMDSKIEDQGGPQKGHKYSLRSKSNDIVMNEEANEENDENVSTLGLDFQIEDHDNIVTNNELEYSKNILPKIVTYLGHEDEICVSEVKPFPCGFCYDIYTEENELRKHIDTIHHGENI